MLIIIAIVFIVALVALPSWWVKHVLDKYEIEREDLAGTGGQLATHLIEKFALAPVQVTVTEAGDHYNVKTRIVGLRQAVFEGKSLTAVATAAHEVGHAIQHHQNNQFLVWRTRFVKISSVLNPLMQVAVIALSAGTFLGAGTLRMAMLVLVIAFVLNIVIHVVTLPVEWDASFGKALPILVEGGYLAPADIRIVKRILFACAMTYVSSAILSVLNVGRWFRGFR